MDTKKKCCSAENTLIILTIFTSISALFCLVMVISLWSNTSIQVWEVSADGYASTAPWVRNVKIGNKNKISMEDKPMGAVVLDADLIFSSGLKLVSDVSDNKILYANVRGQDVQMATFTKDGVVGFGENPLDASIFNNPGDMYITGSPASRIINNWKQLSKVNMTDGMGNVIGSLSSVQFLPDPTMTGIMIYDDAGSVVFSNGKVFVGKISKEYYSSNTNLKVLVGGDVMVENLKQNVDFQCRTIPGSPCGPGGKRVRLQTYSGDSIPGNAKESDVNTTGYFDPTKCYSICSGDYTWLFDFWSSVDSPPTCSEYGDISVRFASDACNSAAQSVNVYIYYGNNNNNTCIDDTSLMKESSTGKLSLVSSNMINDNKVIDCWCPSGFITSLPN